ncbi:hypothetical protein ABIB40_002649 [Pedobacter sp. UYP30]|uniref:Shedu immune nuclease family protein n=1 Tax=Pedobacter sp. UYP30 TaxID=1756400 RepID=UPI003399D886
MTEEPTEYDYFKNKRTDKVYLSKALDAKFLFKNENDEIEEIIRSFRIVSKIIENNEDHQFIKEGKQVSLRITAGGRQEIKAKFYEDTRGITTLTIQKFTTDTGAPHNTYFTFQGDEILTLFNFIRNIGLLPITKKSSEKFEDSFLEEIILTKEQAVELISKNPELVKEIIRNNITTDDIQNLAYRKQQLEKFKKLLEDENYFNFVKNSFKKKIGDEYVWQDFFENNTWIFGYGLNFVFNSPLQDKRLEQVVTGFDFNNSGKRIDALMKTRGLINSFCFGEIKTHKKDLLRQISNPYRGECWAISDELAGAIAQTQKSVQKSIKELSTKVDIKDKSGNLTGEQIFIYQPKSFVVIGHLKEFKTENGVNEDKFSSFELFRQNQTNPEILTFDELYERAKFIVKSDEEKTTNI